MARKSYGLPYKGSKNVIAKDIVNVLPAGNRLVELFAGGCAITDYALKNTNKFNSYLVNDLNGWGPKAYVKALAGGFNDEERWISRDDFFRLKDTDTYVKMCFSFGNSETSYMYSTELEPYKRALHHIIFWSDYRPMEDICPQVVDIIKEYCKDKDRKGRRLASGRAIADHVKQKGSVEYWQSNPLFRAVKVKWTPERRGIKGYTLGNASFGDLETKSSLESLECLERLESLESLECLERLESLQSLECLERLQSLQSLQSLISLERLQNLQSLQSLESLERLGRLFSGKVNVYTSFIDYRNYEYCEGDIVYCDPPYAHTDSYGFTFDTNAFWQWCRSRPYPVYISEYIAPEDFISIWGKEKRVLLNKDNLTKPKVEHLFLHKKWI